jgi:hypothetical protein
MSRTTHGAPEPVAACRYYAALMLGALAGEPKEALLGPRYTPVPGLWAAAPLADRIDAVAAESFRHRAPPHRVDARRAALPPDRCGAARAPVRRVLRARLIRAEI